MTDHLKSAFKVEHGKRFQTSQQSSPIASCRHSQTVAPTDDIIAWCIAVITVQLNKSHMSHAAAAQRGRSHREKPRLQTQWRRQEAFNVFDSVNEGRARYTACVILSRSRFNLVTGWTQTAAEMKREGSKRKKNSLSCVADSFTRNQRSEQTKKKLKKRSNDKNWRVSSVCWRASRNRQGNLGRGFRAENGLERGVRSSVDVVPDLIQPRMWFWNLSNRFFYDWDRIWNPLWSTVFEWSVG